MGMPMHARSWFTNYFDLLLFFSGAVVSTPPPKPIKAKFGTQSNVTGQIWAESVYFVALEERKTHQNTAISSNLKLWGSCAHPL